MSNQQLLFSNFWQLVVSESVNWEIFLHLRCVLTSERRIRRKKPSAKRTCSSWAQFVMNELIKIVLHHSWGLPPHVDDVWLMHSFINPFHKPPPSASSSLKAERQPSPLICIFSCSDISTRLSLDMNHLLCIAKAMSRVSDFESCCAPNMTQWISTPLAQLTKKKFSWWWKCQSEGELAMKEFLLIKW